LHKGFTNHAWKQYGCACPAEEVKALISGGETGEPANLATATTEG